jgi:hypothetical protein
MQCSTDQSIGAIVITLLVATGGDALYEWLSHGSVAWMGILEFGLGWAIAVSGLVLLARMKQKRPNLTNTHGEA